MLRFISFLSCLAVLATLVFAAPSHAAGTCDNPKGFVSNLGDSILSTLKDKSLSASAKEEKLTAMFNEHVDTKWLAKFTVGRFWKEATDEQKTEFVKVYGDYISDYYVSKYTKYTDETFSVTGEKPLSDDEFVVESLINRGSEPAIAVNYRVKKVADCYKVHDFVVEGVSMINTQRADFGSTLSSSGFDGLIEQLKKRKLADGDERSEAARK